jgi:hypothetical protein
VILYDRRHVTITASGTRWSIEPDEVPPPVTIRVGSRTRSEGPLGRRDWETTPQGDFFQSVRVDVVAHARILVPGGLEIPVYGGTVPELELLDASFPLVPPDHLERVLAEKTEHFHVTDSAGLGGSRRHTGGLNPSHDDRATPFDETRAILVTHGALWQYRELGICPTVLHEIGHVMTHAGNGLSIAGTDPDRAHQLAAVRASRNPGPLESLCNAYMYLLCYGASSGPVRDFGQREGDPQRDRRTRNALRRCAAFAGLDPAWQARLAER